MCLRQSRFVVSEATGTVNSTLLHAGCLAPLRSPGQCRKALQTVEIEVVTVIVVVSAIITTQWQL